MPLEDLDAGYICSQLDLGWPEVREVVNSRPDADGIDDRTRYVGGRGVSANIVATTTLGAVLDEVASSFVFFMSPRRRPLLHYVLERDDNPERVLTVRGASYAAPIDGGAKREIALQWVAADPVAYGALEQSEIAWSGGSVRAGRTYNLVFPRVYPSGESSGTTAIISHDGDLPARPLLRIYGPITAPHVAFVYSTGGGADVAFVPAFTIDAGRFVDVDTAAYTAYRDGDVNQPVTHYLVWSSLRWPVLPAAPAHSEMTLTGSSTSGNTQVVASWHDRYLV